MMKNKISLCLITLLIYTFTAFSILAQDKTGFDAKVPFVQPTPSYDTGETKKRRLETFQVVWQTINDNYFDQTFSGLDWKKIKAEYEPQVKALKSDEELHALLQRMISRLQRSHFAIIPPEVFVAIEFAKEKSAIKSQNIIEDELNIESTDDLFDSDDDFEDSDRLSKYGIGIELRFIDKQFLITQIETGSSAEKGNLKVGYILKKINGVSLTEFLDSIRQFNTDTKSFEQKMPIQLTDWFLNGEKGTYLQITVLDENNQSKEVILERKKLSGEFVTILTNVADQYFRYESRSLNEDIGYIKFNFFALPLIEKFCTSITEFKEKKAIIIDLRGNLGGLFGGLIGISGLLIDKPLELGTEIYKDSKLKRIIQPHRKNFKGKIIILTDNLSYSAAEIFSAAFQENGRATIIGETTAGEALPALTKILPTGAVFLFPVSNFKTPKGNVLEGVGVKPNFEVSLKRQALLQGRDDQLDIAQRIAIEQIAAEIANQKKIAKTNRTLKPPPPPMPTKIGVRKKRPIRKVHSRKALAVIDKYIESIGGKDVLEKLNSFKATGTVEISRSGAVVVGGSEILWETPNRYLERYIIDGVGIISEVFDGEDFFVESEFTTTDTAYSFGLIEDKSLSMGFYEVLNMTESYPRISYNGIFNVDNKRVHLIEATSPNGLQVAFVFDTETNLLLKRTSNATGNVEFENYTKIVGGATLPFTITKNTDVIFKLIEITPNFAIEKSSFIRKESCFDKVD